ncbi:hypothetical protein [Desertivirga brevis]|uniref:hypothetical protein n=1 Tax=Desertivirga brevis TaxID=2810310 RepID=UPI001A96A55E|nr:hypothetical protein [Pedobacter sp. SYSU D00873]
MKILCLLLILPLSVGLSDSYDFKRDFERDLKNLKIEHNFHDAKQLKQFEQFKTIKLADFEFVTKTKGNTSLKRWVRKTAGDVKEINVVEVSIPADITEKITDVETGNVSETIPIKGTFTFKTYIFKKISQPKVFYYMTERSQGLIETKIGKIRDAVMYKSVVVGVYSVLDKAKKETEKIMADK